MQLGCFRRLWETQRGLVVLRLLLVAQLQRLQHFLSRERHLKHRLRWYAYYRSLQAHSPKVHISNTQAGSSHAGTADLPL